MRGALGCASAIVALGCTELSPLPVSSFPRDADVAFASDSVTFAFDRTSSTVWAPGLYVGRTDGSGINMLVLNAGDPTWSPDRKTIVCANFYTGVLSRVDVASDSVQPFVTAGFSLAPSWSPDGSLIAFSSTQDNHNPPDLWIVNATGGAPRRVPLPGPPRSEMDDPSWSPDGHYIVVSQGERLFRTDTLGVDTAWITPPGVFNISPAWSPRGSWIAYIKASNSGYGDLWLIHPDGTGDHKIADTAAIPGWTPDGARIAFTRVGKGEIALWSVDTAGRGLVRLTSPAH